jgi:hypothetical protein
MEGYVYCFTNPSMPNLIKCGGTKRDPQTRCKELFNTSLPVECKVEYYIKVKNWRDTEKEIHDKIIEAGFERCKGREWFSCSPFDIKHLFDNYSKEKQIIINNITVNKTINNIKNIHIKKNNYTCYECKKCNYSTRKKFDFEKHLVTIKHIERTKKIYTCENCNKIYNSKSGYYSHKKKCHDNHEKDDSEHNKEIEIDSELKMQLLLTQKELEIEKIKRDCEKEKVKIIRDILKNLDK